MTVNELESQIVNLTDTLKQLEKALNGPESTLEDETALLAAQRRLERLERQLSELRAREEADREKAERLAAQARLVELKAIYLEGCSEVARLVNDAAKELEPILSAVVEKRRELRQLDNEHYTLYKKLNGEKPDLDRLWSNINVVPGEHVPLTSYSPVVNHLGLAMFAAVSEREGLPYTLSAILSVLRGAESRRDVDNGPKPTLKHAEDGDLSEMQRFARARRVNFD